MTRQKLDIDPDRGYMMFDVTEYISGLQLPHTVNGMKLKREFHVSLLPATRVIERLTDIYDERVRYAHDFVVAANEASGVLGDVRLTNDFYTCTDDERGRKTIIGKVAFAGLDMWQDEVRKVIGDVEFPVPHSTLYVSKGAPGIGINTTADFDKYAVPLDNGAAVLLER